MSVPPPMPVIRSSFVNALGWIFVCLAALATLVGVLQNVMFQLVILPNMQQQLATQPLPADMPAAMGWIFTHMIWFFRAFLLLSVTTLVAAIGLLQRRDWARRLFIGLLVVAIAYQLLGLVAQWWFLGAMQHTLSMPANAPAQFAHGMRAFMLVVHVLSAIMATGLSVLFGWIIKRLHGAAIRQEFREAAAARLFSGHRE